MNNNKNYSVRIGESLYRRIDKHIQLLKHLDRTQNKKTWVERSIQNKLNKDESLSVIERSGSEKHLNFTIPFEMNNKIEKSVDVAKKFRTNSYSKKKWILEAILEKLESQEKTAENSIETMIETALETEVF